MWQSGGSLTVCANPLLALVWAMISLDVLTIRISYRPCALVLVRRRPGVCRGPQRRSYGAAGCDGGLWRTNFWAILPISHEIDEIEADFFFAYAAGIW